MKTFYFLTLFVCSAVLVRGQIVPNSNQAFQFAPAFNPAFTGVEEFTSIKIGYRKQWVSFPDAPQYLNVVVATRLNQPADMVHNGLFMPNRVQADQLPKRKRIINSIGGILINQKYGIFEELDFGISYSFQYPIGKKTYLSLGVSPHYSNARSQLDKIVTRDPDRYVDYLKTQSGSNTTASVNAGLLIYSSRFYVHGSFVQAWRKVLTETLTDQGYNIIATAGVGFNFNVSDKLKVKPSVTVLLDDYNDMINDYAAKLYFGDQIMVGAAYRDSGFAIASFGYEFNSVLGAGYSYEIATGKLKGFSSGSHEIVLGIKLGNLKKVTPVIW